MHVLGAVQPLLGERQDDGIGQPARQITESLQWVDRDRGPWGSEPPQFEQPQYSMLKRDRFETEYHPLYQAPYNIGTTIWSPLASGILTGKYNDGDPEGSRLTQPGYGFLVGMLDRYKAAGALDKVAKLQAFAKETFDASVTQLALAWCVKNKNVTTVLLGATKTRQLEENLGAIKVIEQLTDEHMATIEEILGNRPDPYMGYGGKGDA